VTARSRARFTGLVGVQMWGGVVHLGKDQSATSAGQDKHRPVPIASSADVDSAGESHSCQDVYI